MKKVILFVSFAWLLFFSANYCWAQAGSANNTGGNVGTASNPCTSGQACLQNPIDVSSPQALIGKIINVILGVVGSIALVMFVYGGITWMTSAGSADKIKKGREIVVWAVIGLVIIFSSYALVNFVIKGIAK